MYVNSWIMKYAPFLSSLSIAESMRHSAKEHEFSGVTTSRGGRERNLICAANKEAKSPFPEVVNETDMTGRLSRRNLQNEIDKNEREMLVRQTPLESSHEKNI